jgi:low temperature requirement protein LtrA
VAWSVVSGVLWLAGAMLDGDHRLLLWGPALAVDLVAPVTGYWVPGRGRVGTTDYAVEGGHFAERCQGFIIIALGESVVVTGATAADHGLTTPVVFALVVAFLETAALWWLYFGLAAGHSRRVMREAEDPGRLARDAYTYLHLPIVAGIIGSAVADDLLLAEPHASLSTVGVAMMVGGPALYLLGESLFRLRMVGTVGWRRIVAIVVLVALAPLGPHVSVLALATMTVAVLTALALWEYASR